MTRIQITVKHLSYNLMCDQVLYCMQQCALKNDCANCPQSSLCRKSYDVLISRLYSGKELTRLSS